MKKLTAALLTAMFSLSVLFVSEATVNAAPPAGDPAVQIVPTTKRVTKKVYRGGRRVTVTTWRHGKRITKKVWRKSNRIGHKVGRKTRNIVVGPKRRTP